MITQTIEKQDGHGPYLWAVVWKNKDTQEQIVSVFSFWEAAKNHCESIQSNGHEAQLDLAVDNTQKVKAVSSIAAEDPELFAWMQGVSAMAAGDFLSNLVRSAFHADGPHTRILYPALKQLQAMHPKYQKEVVQL